MDRALPICHSTHAPQSKGCLMRSSRQTPQLHKSCQLPGLNSLLSTYLLQIGCNNHRFYTCNICSYSWLLELNFLYVSQVCFSFLHHLVKRLSCWRGVVRPFLRLVHVDRIGGRRTPVDDMADYLV